MKSRSYISLFSTMCLMSILAAQPPTTRIRGTVVDEQGSPLPGVTVTLRAPGFIPRSTMTSPEGAFLFTAVPPGVYSISAQLSGFAIREMRDISVTIAQTVSLNISLLSGAVPPPPPPPTKHLPALDAAISGLPLGQIMYNPPTEMIEQKTERVEARISQSLTEDLKAGLRGMGVPNVENIKVSSSMKAGLAGADFEILELSEPVQQVPSSGYTQWEWDVKPNSAGNKVLHLSVSAVFDTDYGEKRKSFPVMDKPIYVKVDKRLHPFNWELALKYAGGIVGIAAGLFGIYKGLKAAKKKRRGQKRPD